MTILKKEFQLVKNDTFKIEPLFTLSPNFSYFENYIKSIQELVETIVCQYQTDDPNKMFSNLYQNLPLISHTDFCRAPSCLAVTVLCQGEYTYGAGKFISDMLSRWLIPGKQIAVRGTHSLAFRFVQHPKKTFFIAQYFMSFETDNEITAVKKNISSLTKEIRLIILSVYQARHIVSINKLSNEQKSALLQENISSLLSTEGKEVNSFDHMQNILMKLSAEKKLSEIKSNIALLMNKRPKSFDREIFESVHNISLIYRGNFTILRKPRYVSRIVGLQYLFKKSLVQLLHETPNTRHIFLKLLRTQLVNSEKKVLGILIIMNLLHENERFEKNYIIDAINLCVKEILVVNNSYVVDYRDDKILSFYLEIEKTSGIDFSLEELKTLKTKLGQEIKSRMENTLNPIFLPRNEEEILRNIILLSKQLNYVKDIPQVIISFDKQNGKEIAFTVILLRLLKKESYSLKELFTYSNTFLKFSQEEVKIVGLLKKKYPKEANIFRLSLNKEPFFRSDFSLDLQKARQALATELFKVIGDFRDYNGGMISKQSQALDSLKMLFNKLVKLDELLLENFFYSIRPGIMQSVIEPNTLKQLFDMLMEILKEDFSKEPYLIDTQSYERDLLVMIATTKINLNDVVASINKLKIPSFELCSFLVENGDIKTLGYIYKAIEPIKRLYFQNTLLHALKKSSLN